MGFGILGVLTLDAGDGVFPFDGSPRQRTLLAILLLHRGETVAVERLVNEMWPSWPPDSAIANLRTYLCGIRAKLGHERHRLVTRPGGYLLDVGPRELDADWFLDEARAGRGELQAGNALSAATMLRRALARWRGRVLDDVPLSRSLRMHTDALEAQRLNAREDLIQAHLLLGEHTVAAAAARSLLALDPTRESAWYLLVSALHEGGDPSGALRTYQQACRTLAERLGLDPSPRLAKLQLNVLRRLPTHAGV